MDDPSERPLVTMASVLGGVAGGLVHAVVAVVLWTRWFDSLWELLVTKPLIGGYLLLGMFLLGFVPVLFYAGRRVISPAVLVAGFLLLSGVGSWLAGPVGAPAAVPTPLALYLFLWVGIVALAGLLGGLEYRRQRQPTG